MHSQESEYHRMILQDVVREIIPKLRGVSFTNEFLESVFNPRETHINDDKGKYFLLPKVKKEDEVPI